MMGNEASNAIRLGGKSRGEQKLRTGVRSRSESASLADVAASMRSSHLLFITDATPCGSAENAFLPSILSRRACSLDLVRSCFSLRLFCVMEDLLGLPAFSRRCIGGRVEERPGGDRDKIEGRSSRACEAGKGGLWSWLT